MTFGVFAPPFRPVFDLAAVAPAHPAADWWLVAGKTTVAAYQPKGAASLAASYTNLANPGTNDAAPVVAPTWSSGTGWTFDGATQYLTTGIVPVFSAWQSVWTMLVQFSGASTDGGTLIGEFTDGARFELQARALYSDNHYYHNGESVLVSGRLSSGNMAIAGAQGYLDGDADGSAISAGYATTTLDLWIANRNGAADFYGGDIQAIAIYSDTLTAGEVATVSAAMAAL